MLVGRERPIELFELVYNLLPDKFLSYNYISSLALIHDYNGWNNGWITSLFIHGDYTHLLNNLTAAFQLGYAAYANYGSFGLYSLFIFGGIASSIPSPIHDISINVINKAYQNFDSGLDLFQVLKYKIHNIFESLGIKKVGFKRAYIGSSGAVCALMGFDTILQFQLLIRKIHNIMTVKSRSDKTEISNLYAYYNVKADRHDIESLILNIIRSVAYFVSEYNHLSNPIHINGCIVNSATHLQGLIFGAGVGLMVNTLPILLRQYYRRL